MRDRQGESEGGAPLGRRRGDESYLGHMLLCHGSEGREPQMFQFPCVVVCFLLKNIDNPSPFPSSLSPLSLMSTWEGRKGRDRNGR